MTEETKTFCAEFAPFRSRPRVCSSGLQFVIVDQVGHDVAICDDDDVAHVVAEALNATAGRES
jgi:hypothetical protein